jgi:hypothetical protein
MFNPLTYLLSAFLWALILLPVYLWLHHATPTVQTQASIQTHTVQ